MHIILLCNKVAKQLERVQQLPSHFSMVTEKLYRESIFAYNLLYTTDTT